MNSLSEPPVRSGVREWLPPDLRMVSAHGIDGQTPSGPTLEEAAYARGWMEGQAAFAESSGRDLEASIGACRAAMRALEDASTGLRTELATTVHTLSLAVARHLLDREFAADPEQIHRLVGKALALAPVSGPVTVRLHPEDLAALQAIGGLDAMTPTAVDLRWIGDATLVRGGCVVEAPTSIIDGRIDRALLDLYERLGHE
ncbi:MAG: FliH/SctL family protein [Gemmatimonadales bacterium]